MMIKQDTSVDIPCSSIVFVIDHVNCCTRQAVFYPCLASSINSYSNGRQARFFQHAVCPLFVNRSLPTDLFLASCKEQRVLLHDCCTAVAAAVQQ